jgi:sugar O-acyltransferase (sialic acid O-acetyltransferase NeuD family)
MKKNLVVWGATGQSIVLEEILGNEYNLLALFDNNEQQVSPFPSVPLYYKETGFDTWLKAYNGKEALHYIVAIGGAHGKDRLAIHNRLQQKGLIPVSAIHSTAFIARNAQLDEAVQVMAHASICARVQLGRSTMINTSASVDHECIISEGVHIGPGAKLAGRVTVGKNSFIGTGAIVLPNITIGENVVVGAGSVVTKDIAAGITGYGNPFNPKQ